MSASADRPHARAASAGRAEAAAITTRGAWLLAARPRTLPAALAPIAVGTATAAAAGRARPGLALAALGTAVALQIAANLANDVFDFERGADAGERHGPPRAAQCGLLAPAALKRGLAGALAGAALLGLVLVFAGGWPILVAGALSLLAAWAYTGGPWPLAYHGLGDLAVFLFFGIVGVIGAHFVQAGGVSTLALAAAIPVGALCTAILAVNNLRDRLGDARVGKRTLAVRLGDGPTRVYYALLLGVAFATPLVCVALGLGDAWLLLPLVLLPEAGALLRRVLEGERGGALNAVLARTARLAAAFGLLFAVGIAA
ncbi:MAG TPA: 1,4-dihydroxy-2-naphthoate polyprenyltransferase [Myxococcota bacterium]|nr:1,4-dihydroxy-2-naphthoate polyprenyltransferase [Myxococcota bacterium]